MSFKHIRIEFAIDIDEHKRDKKYQEQKAIESLELAIKHIKEHGLKRTLSFDDDGMVDLWFNAYTRSYAFPTSCFKSIRHLVEKEGSTTKEERLRYKIAYEKEHKPQNEILSRIRLIQNDWKTPWFEDVSEKPISTEILIEAINHMIEHNEWICPIKQVRGDDAYYSISKNEIVVPEKDQFLFEKYFYTEVLHNMVHSSGTEDYFKRLKPSSYGSIEYAREELVAEWAAAKTASSFGIKKYCKEDSLPYIKNWIELLEDDDSRTSIIKDVMNAHALIFEKIIQISKEMENEKEKEKVSPILRQFLDLKKKHSDALLLFRCGDFYETYKQDAVAVSEILGITLTRSSKSKDDEGNLLAMAGFPYHCLDSYLPKLIRAGNRVAICDQIEAPKK